MMEKAPLLQLIGPVTVRAGEEFLIGVRQQSAGIEAADLTLSFDRGLVEPADQVAEATNDRSLRLPAGTSSMAQIRFRALRAVSGAASFRLGPAALKVGGQDVQVDAPAPFTVQVTP